MSATADLYPYLAVATAPGTLADRIAYGGSPPDTVPRTAAVMADGLATLHGLGLVHGALRPATTLLTGGGAPVLAGYDTLAPGLAVVLPPDGYCAPERLPAVGGSASMAADVYELAATTYVAAGGFLPWLAGGDDAAVDPNWRGAPLVDPPGVAGEFAAALRWALSPYVEARPSAAQLRDALVAAVAGGAVATKPLWSPSAKPVAGASSPAVRGGSATPPAQPTTPADSTAPSASGAPVGGTYPPAGTYDLGSPPTIYDDGRVKVTWTRSQVYPYSTVPNLWYVELTYLNTGDATQHFTCTGWTDPGRARQYLYRGGSLVGSDGATETMCSSSPNWTIDLPAGNSFVSWARFGTVPQSGDSVALQWGEFGRTPALSPYAEG